MSNEDSISLSTVVPLDEISRSDQAGNGVRWSLEAGEDLNMNLVHLEPGSGVDMHTNHEVDVVVIVLDGNGQVSINTIDHELAPHVLALAPRRSQRSISAGPAGLTYLTVHRRRGPLQITAGTARRRGSLDGRRGP